MDKKNLRAKLKQIRASILPNNADELLRNNFLSNTQLKPTDIIGTYIPTQFEIEVGKLNRALGYSGYKLCLPCIENGAMIFREWGINTELEENKFGIKQPTTNNQKLTPSIIIVPLLGFNPQKFRLGYGGGFYDKYFASHPTLKIGVAYSAQLVTENFEETHDIALDMIITEKTVYK